MSWSAQQCRLLDALGYERLEPGRPPPLPSASGPIPRATPTQAPAASRPMRVADPAPAMASPPASVPANLSRLREALRRAANGADPSHLVEDLEGLRGDPARKRALWPRLRALRRSH